MACGSQHASGSSSQMYTSYGRGSLLPSTIKVPTMSEHNDLLSFLTVVQYHDFEFLHRKWDDDRKAIGAGASAEIRDLLIPQTSLSRKAEFAFKRHKALPSRKGQEHQDESSHRERIFNQLVAEVTILGHPLIRYHQNIVNLEAVYLEIPDSNSEPAPVVPVLVLEKADLGDLWYFATSSRGLQLSFEERLGVCLDIGHALKILHDHEMIHGDVKPQNVLVFVQNAYKLEPEIIYAKLADFGYAAWNMDPGVEVAIYLPRSRPWDAPEYHHRAFNMKQAKQLDIFSFGLLCFWFLFHDSLQSFDPAPLLQDLDSDAAAQFTNLFMRSGFSDIKAVERLKCLGVIPTVARQLLITAPFCDVRKQHLNEFFSSTLNQDPDKRLLGMSYLMAVTNHEASYNIKNLDVEQENLDHSTMAFRITPSFVPLMHAKHRVREYIALCLQNEALNGLSLQSRQNAAFQYSLCCKLGFGCASSDEDSTNWLLRSGKSVEHLQLEVNLIKERVQHRLGFRYGDKVWLRLGRDGDLDKRITPSSRERQNILKILIREAEDLARTLGPDLVYTVGLKRNLAVLAFNSNQIDHAERLILGILDASTTNPSLNKGSNGLPPTQPPVSESQNKIRDTVGSLELFQPAVTNSSPEFERLLESCENFQDGGQNISYILSRIYMEKKRFEEAEKLLVQARTMLAYRFEESDDDMLTITRTFGILYARLDRYAEEEKVYTFLVRLCEYGFVPQDKKSLFDQMNLARVQGRLGKYAMAEKILKNALRLFKSGRIENLTSDLYSSITSTLSNIYIYQRRYKEAEILARETLSSRLNSSDSGADSEADKEDTLNSVINLATSLSRQGSESRKEAIKTLTTALQTQWCLDNQLHSAVLTATRKLALCLYWEGKYVESDTLFQQILSKQHAILPAHDSRILETKRVLSWLYNKQRRFKEAEELFLPLIEGRKALLQDSQQIELLYSDWKSALADVYVRQRRFKEAETFLLDVVKTTRKFFPTNHPKFLESEAELGAIYCRQKRYKDAEAILAGKIDLYSSIFGKTHSAATLLLSDLAESFAGQRRWKDADEATLMLMDMIKDSDHTNPSREWVMGFRAYVLVGRGRLFEAVPYAWRAFPILDRSWVRFRSFLDRFLNPHRHFRNTGYTLAIFLTLALGLMLKRTHFSLISRLGFIH